jgi:multiple antibiotic resistance protein
MPDASLVAFSLLSFSSLLAIVDPLAATPMFLSLTSGHTLSERKATVLRATLTAIAVMAGFGMLGRWIFSVFGITINAFRIAGGIIFFSAGLDMLQARRSRVKATEQEEEEGSHKDDVGVTPLGMPMIAGPGAITTVMVRVSQAGSAAELVSIYVAILAVGLVTWLVLSASNRVVVMFGQTGLNVMTRIMGLLVTVVGVQSVINGVTPMLTGILRQALR